MTYASARAFRQALNDRLTNLARAQGLERSRLQRRVAFERFLARVYQRHGDRLILKGGYALELRLGRRARATMDLDFAAPLQSQVELLEVLQEAAELDLGDFFRYTLAAGKPPGLIGPPEGGLRFRVEARLDRPTPFSIFFLDVGMGDPEVEPTEYLAASLDLGFAGLPAVAFPATPLTQHFAEKLHAYTRPRTARTRVKDLVDLILMIEVLGVQPSAELAQVLPLVFNRYASHPLPTAQTLEPPPKEWSQSYAALMAELELGGTLDDAHRRLVGLLEQMGRA